MSDLPPATPSNILYWVASVLVLFFIFGLILNYGGELIYILLVLAAAAILIRIIQGRRPL